MGREKKSKKKEAIKEQKKTDSVVSLEPMNPQDKE